jgi:hypothetical protein
MPPNTSNGTKIIAKRRISHKRRLETGIETGVVGIIAVTSGENCSGLADSFWNDALKL